ncbi:MAG: wax ester/triacylglycerol synthase family O-acyltransferase, partial [Ramlibacter sp.]|nr:wax ester/triacylglycerol synthase family O-acyltransferase [Ramlibacter sp.]
MVTRIVASQVAKSAGKTARRAVRSVQTNATRAATGMLGMTGERMTKVDTAWLRMDSPSNLMMIVGVWTIQPGVRYEDLCQRVEERLLKYARFRQRVEQDTAGATWIEDEEFDIGRHVVREKLAKSAKGHEQQVLQDRVGELAMQPLDAGHPLWQIHLIEDYQGGSAMLVRIHHCIADGIALISVTMSLVDGGEPPPERKRKSGAATGTEDWIADTLIKPFTDMTVKALGAAGEGAVSALGMLRDPQKGMAGSLDLAKLAYQVVSDV